MKTLRNHTSINHYLLTVVLVFFMGCAGTSGYRTAEKHLERQEYQKALRAYLKVLNPRIREGKRYIDYQKEAVTGIGIVYWRMQQFSVAEAILKIVRERDPYFGQALYYLGMTYEGMGDESQALAVYQSYEDIPREDPYKRVILARLDWLKRITATRLVQKALREEAFRPVPSNKKSVAVFYFLDLGEDRTWRPLQKALAEMIIRDLASVPEVRVVDRYQIEALMTEANLTVSDFSKEIEVQRFGRLLDAYHLVTGSFLITRDLRLTLDCTVSKADAALFPNRFNFDGTLSRLFKIEKEIVLRILDELGVSLDIQQREKLLQLPTENIAAFVSYGRGLDALDRMDLKGAQVYFREALGNDPNFTWADDWLMLPEIWQAVQSANLARTDFEVTRLVKTTSKGRVQMVYKPPPDLLSTWNRLQWMSLSQNAGFIPGNDTREAFQEAWEWGVGVMPEILAEPPPPVSITQP